MTRVFRTPAPYKLLPVINNILGARRFFLLCFFVCFFVSFFHFHRTLFVGLREFCVGLREPRKFFQTLFLYIHLFVY